MMPKVRTALALTATLVVTGCYHAVVETGRPANGQEVRRSWAHSFIGGLVPPSAVNVAQECPNGLARVETQQSFLNLLASAVTFGIYTPMDIRVMCAGATALRDAVQVPANATLAQKQEALTLAAERSADLERAVHLKF